MPITQFAVSSSTLIVIRYNRIDLFAPAGVVYVNGSSLQSPFFSLSPVSFNTPEAFLPGDAAALNFRNVQALVEAINSGTSPIPKSSSIVADGLTFVAESELKALSVLASTWPSRNVAKTLANANVSAYSIEILSSASVFAVAVRSAVAFEFPGQISDGVESSSSEAKPFSPMFASSLSNLNLLSLTWCTKSSSVVASVPLPFPARLRSSSAVNRFVNYSRFRQMHVLIFYVMLFLSGIIAIHQLIVVFQRKRRSGRCWGFYSCSCAARHYVQCFPGRV
jgi:hypothetical protein